jgi:hypothetical protein
MEPKLEIAQETIVEIIRVYHRMEDPNGSEIETVPTRMFILTHPLAANKQFHISKLPEDIQEYILKHNRCQVMPESVSDLLELLNIRSK